MNTRKQWYWKNLKLANVLLIALFIAGCNPLGSRARVGDLQTESQTVELDDAESVRVEVNLGAGDLAVTGGAQQLLEADFNYNVAELKPEVDYSGGTLIIQHPDVDGLPVLRDISGYRNEWDLHLNNEVPMSISIDFGAGTSDLQLADLSLTGLNLSLGAGESTIDLSGAWEEDVDVGIDAGAGELTLRLPADVGARVVIDAGLGNIDAPEMTKDENVYTNAAYGTAAVTLQVDINAGVGTIALDVE